MPSVLVETGYLTNPDEEAYLNGRDGQAATVEALYRGVETYMRDRRRELRAGRPVLATQTSSLDLQASATPLPPADYVPAPGAAPTEPQLRLTTISEPDRTLEAHVADATPAEDYGTLPAVPPSTAKTPSATGEAAPKPVAGTTIYVQLSASAKTLDTSRGKWARLGQSIRAHREGDYYKYQAGPFATVAEAERVKRAVRKGDFPDAFTIGYRNGVKLTAAEMREVE